MEAFDVLREKWEAKIENGNLQSLLDEKLSVAFAWAAEKRVREFNTQELTNTA